MSSSRVRGRKLLVASVGVAAVSYASACQKAPEQTGNLMAPTASTTPPEMVGNLVAPPPEPPDAGERPPEMVGNLMPPGPPPPPTDGPKKKAR